MTAPIVADFEVGIIAVNLVWCTMLPFVQLALGIPFVPIVAICPVGRCLLVCHGSAARVKLNLTEAC